MEITKEFVKKLKEKEKYYERELAIVRMSLSIIKTIKRMEKQFKAPPSGAK